MVDPFSQRRCMEFLNEETGCKLLWLDMEMTGLDPLQDAVLEIAVVASDIQLETIVEGPHLIIHQSDEILDSMGQWCYEQHTASGLLDLVKESSIDCGRAEQMILSFVGRVCSSRPLLAGNTIYQDRAFLKQYMPKIESLLHYRQIDVSSVKELVKGWYPQNKQASFVKQKRHRALDDIFESMNELRYYRSHFFVS
ncbi:MAG: Oligoribonuclease [candidate division TM6 bacterium GW2011_GWF2_43_17]|nr:MAG: Oligoribonuclease [candidate division TM6 bacterium GW2011_GWF2_43_17]